MARIVDDMIDSDLPTGPLSGFLHVWCFEEDLAKRFGDVAKACDMTSLACEARGVIRFQVHDVSSLPDFVSGYMSLTDQRRVRVLFSANKTPTLEEFGHVRSLEQFCLELSSRWLKSLLAEHRLKSLMQPIVTASESPKIMGYEFLLRGVQTDGTEIPAPVMFKVKWRRQQLALLVCGKRFL